MELLDLIKQNAQKHFKRIVLPEGSSDDRTMKAADQAIAEKTAQIIIIGNREETLKKAKDLGLTNIEKAKIVDPKNHEKKEQYINMMVELRKTKGLTKEEASKLIEDPLYLGCIMIKMCIRDSL